jgi:hypothetical protein
MCEQDPKHALYRFLHSDKQLKEGSIAQLPCRKRHSEEILSQQLTKSSPEQPLKALNGKGFTK